VKQLISRSPISFVVSTSLASLALVGGSLASTDSAVPPDNITPLLQRLFAGKEVKIEDYDEQLKQVVVDGDHLFVSHDGRYVFAGPVYDTQRKIDIVADRERVFRKNLLSSLQEDLYIHYPSKVEQKHRITVVTDIDCPYCRRFHNTVGELNQLGVSVSYLMMPRAGVKSASFAKTLNALCATDPAGAITRAMAGGDQANLHQNCNSDNANRLIEHISLAQKMKIGSTPSFITPSGDLHIGLRSTEQLLDLLDSNRENQQGAR
jgi:thiol:disulfide interchange protein DsbC